MSLERRLEDRIRKLCAQAIVSGSNEFNPILAGLKAALHEHTERLRARAAASTFCPADQFSTERRAVVITRESATSEDAELEANAVESEQDAVQQRQQAQSGVVLAINPVAQQEI